MSSPAPVRLARLVSDGTLAGTVIYDRSGHVVDLPLKHITYWVNETGSNLDVAFDHASFELGPRESAAEPSASGSFVSRVTTGEWPNQDSVFVGGYVAAAPSPEMVEGSVA